MKTSLPIDTDLHSLVYKDGMLIISNLEKSPVSLPKGWADTLIEPKDRKIIDIIKKTIQEPHNTQKQVVGSASLRITEGGDQTVLNILKKYENLLWSYRKEGKGKKSKAFTYYLID